MASNESTIIKGRTWHKQQTDSKWRSWSIPPSCQLLGTRRARRTHIKPTSLSSRRSTRAWTGRVPVPTVRSRAVCAPVDRLVQAQGAFLMVVERIGARWVFDNSGTWADKSLETLAPTVLLISSRSASQTTASFARDMTRK